METVIFQTFAEDETQLKQLEEQHKEDNIEIEGLKSCVAELENAIKRQQLADLEGINKDEIGHKRDFISNIIREIIAMNAKMSLSSFLLHVPGVICLLSFVCHKWLQDKNLPSICYVDKGKTHFLTDTCRKCPHFLQKISETMDSISTEILPVLKRTENFTLLLLQKNFSRIWESFSDIIMPISKVSLKIQDHVETIEKMSNDMLLEVDKYIAEDIWMDKMTDIRRSFFEITTFFRSFGNRIRLIHSLSAEIQTNIQIKPSTDSSTNLLTDITCKQMGNLYAVVVVVNSVCESYLQMDREHLPKLVSTLEKIISSSKEKVETFDYDKVLNITTENIKTLVQKQKSALEENLNEVFRVHLNK